MSTTDIVFINFFLEKTSPFLGATIILAFWNSGDFCFGFQINVDSPLCTICQPLDNKYDSRVLYPLTFSNSKGSRTYETVCYGLTI